MAFPDVPFAPGVPALPRVPGVVVEVAQLLVADALSLLSGLAQQPWGLFLNGEPVVTAESVVSFDFKKDANIPKFPIEGGSFESYNKVKRPFDVRLSFSTGGSPADRQALLESVDAAVDSLDLMDAVSPEAVYPSVNPIHYDYRRTSSKGVTLLVVDVFCEQVRVRASSTFTTSSSSTTPASGNGAAGAGSNGTDANASASFNDRFSAAGSIVEPKPASATPLVNGGVVQSTTAAPDQFSLSQALP